nr:unnamed protein product [Callosobruchus analis]
MDVQTILLQLQKILKFNTGCEVKTVNSKHVPDIFLDPVQKVTLLSSNLAKSIEYWNGILGLQIFEQTDNSVLLGFKENEAKLELYCTGEEVTRGKAYGRIAFSCLHEEQPPLSELIEQKGQTILTPLISLPTPGKPDVRVIILADPDGHEICFVDDESYRELSQPDPESEYVLELHMGKDTS